jgi:hypothetical protein
MSFQVRKGITNECNESFRSSNTIEDLGELASFISIYKKTINSTDIDVLKGRYSENVLFSCKDNDIYIKIEKMYPIVYKMTERYKSNGYKESIIKNVEYIQLDEYYCLVKIYIDMLFINDKRPQYIRDIKATYIIKNENGNYKVIVQIDHQDLPSILRKEGLLKEEKIS